MNPKDAQSYPSLLATLEARRTQAQTCKHCGLVNAAWPGPNWTRNHPSCERSVVKRLEALQRLNGKGENDGD